jgi:putative addiction module component (TIGR02574 family)
MPYSYEEVKEIAQTLPEDQRILLANALWETVSSCEDEATVAEIDAAWSEEIKHRLDEIDSGAVEMIPGDQVRAEMFKCLSPQARTRLRV